MKLARTTISVVLAAGLGVTAAADTSGGARIDVGLGHDTNPLLVSGEKSSGSFTELRIDAGLTHRLGRRWGLFATLDGRARRHSGSVSNADSSFALGEGGVSWTPAPEARRGVTVLAGGFAAVRRATLTDPVTGEVYAVRDVLPSSSVPIGRRMDADQTGAFVEVRWRVHRRIGLAVEGRAGSTNYVEDYDGLGDLEPLDYHERTVRPRMSFRVAEPLWLEASYARSTREYDEFLARDREGDRVPFEKRRFEYSGFELRVRYSPGARWTVDAGHLGTDRRDAFAGFLDTRGRTTYVAASRRLGLFHRLDLYVSRTELDYDRATVTSDPASDVRSQDTDRVSARLERLLRGRSKWFATVTRETSDNRDPRYAYDRTWLQTGIRLEM